MEQEAFREAPGPGWGWILVGLVLATLIPRAAVFGWNENLYGDAVVRTQLAQAWLRSPHWIGSFTDGARQFGPLHVYLLALALWLWPSPEHAGRLLSLILGVASVVPLALLTRRLFSTRAAVWAGLGFAAWGLHIQMSTTAGSEALSTFLVLWALVFYERARALRTLTPLLASALFINLACATRYDVWMLIPLLCVGFFLDSRDRAASATQAIALGLASLAFPLLWMHGNELATGHPLAPLRFIDDFHHTWALETVARWGAWRARLLGLFFWPGVALATLSPLVGLFGLVGMARGYRRRPSLRWLFWLVAAPTAYFSARSVLLSFVPLARFAVSQVVLVLPWVEDGFQALFGGARRWVQGAALALSAAVALALPLGLALATYRQEGPVVGALRPISPVSTNPPALMQAARWVGSHLPDDASKVLIDSDAAYSDLQLIFFSGVPDARFIPRRWPDQLLRRTRYPPGFVVVLDGGQLERDPDVHQVPGGLEVAGVRYTAWGLIRGPYRLFRRDGLYSTR